MKRITLILALFSFTFLQAQRKIENSAEILHEMQKLKVVGNVLYLAAHPDDENTRLIAWLENEKKVRTAYLSLTRGPVLPAVQSTYTKALQIVNL